MSSHIPPTQPPHQPSIWRCRRVWILASLLSAPPLEAVPIIFTGGEPSDPPIVHYQSNAITPIPNDGSFKFELGVFTSGFAPTAANTDQWLANWTPISDSSGNPMAAATADFKNISSIFGNFDGFNSTVDLTHNNPPLNVGVQAYIWGYDNRSTTGSGQWILLTNSTTWILPDTDSLVGFVQNWTVGSAAPGETQIGSINGPSMTTGMVTIALPGAAEITIADANANEYDDGVTFAVTLSEPLATTISVDYEVVAVTANPANDFTVSSGTVTIDAGQTSKPLMVDISQDSVDENDETFLVVFTNPQGASLANAQATGTIIDDDPPPIISIGEGRAYENSGTVQIAITLSTPSEKTVSATFVQSGGNLIEGVDISSLPTSISLAPGETTLTVTATVFDDAIPEVDKSKLIALTSPVNAVFDNIAAILTIIDDEALAQLEESGSLSFDPATGDITISWAAVSGRPYHVLFSTDLTNWSPLPGAGSITADSATPSFVHSSAGLSRSFYKIADGWAPGS